MTTKSEFAAANRELTAETCASIGEPPSAEEVLAYARGELAPEDEARIRERLIAYPDLVRTLTTPFPEGAEPDHPDYLSEHEFARHWKALQKRRQRSNRGGKFLPVFAAVAATAAIVFGAMLWRAKTELKMPQAVWEQQELYPDGRRGLEGGPQTLSASGDSYLLMPLLMGSDATAEKLRAEIVDTATPPHTIWSGKPVPRTPNGSFVILVPRDSLQPGTYRLVVYAINGERQEPLSSFTLRVPAR